MPLPGSRLRTLMIVVAIVALELAGLTRGSPAICTLSLVVAMLTPIVALLAYLARRIGINTLFR